MNPSRLRLWLRDVDVTGILPLFYQQWWSIHYSLAFWHEMLHVLCSCQWENSLWLPLSYLNTHLSVIWKNCSPAWKIACIFWNKPSFRAFTPQISMKSMVIFLEIYYFTILVFNHKLQKIHLVLKEKLKDKITTCQKCIRSSGMQLLSEKTTHKCRGLTGVTWITISKLWHKMLIFMLIILF